MWVTPDEHRRLHGKNTRKYIVCYDNKGNVINVYNTDEVHIKYLTEEEYNNLQFICRCAKLR